MTSALSPAPQIAGAPRTDKEEESTGELNETCKPHSLISILVKSWLLYSLSVLGGREIYKRPRLGPSIPSSFSNTQFQAMADCGKEGADGPEFNP